MRLASSPSIQSRGGGSTSPSVAIAASKVTTPGRPAIASAVTCPVTSSARRYGAREATGAKTPACRALLIRAAARQSFSSQSSLSSFVSGLISTATALASRTPQNAMTVSKLFSARTSTRSPRPIPRRRRARTHPYPPDPAAVGSGAVAGRASQMAASALRPAIRQPHLRPHAGEKVRRHALAARRRDHMIDGGGPAERPLPVRLALHARAGLVAAINLAAYSALARPHLDSFEHDGTLGAVGMTIS
jgi:hypothetical protein